jgi:hypothetical protein
MLLTNLLPFGRNHHNSSAVEPLPLNLAKLKGHGFKSRYKPMPIIFSSGAGHGFESRYNLSNFTKSRGLRELNPAPQPSLLEPSGIEPGDPDGNRTRNHKVTCGGVNH